MLIQLNISRLGQQKVVLFLETDRVKKFLSLTRAHSRMCIRIYIFSFKKQTNKKKKTRIEKKQKKLKKRIFSENRLKKTNLRPPG